MYWHISVLPGSLLDWEQKDSNIPRLAVLARSDSVLLKRRTEPAVLEVQVKLGRNLVLGSDPSPSEINWSLPIDSDDCRTELLW